MRNPCDDPLTLWSAKVDGRWHVHMGWRDGYTFGEMAVENRQDIRHVAIDMLRWAYRIVDDSPLAIRARKIKQHPVKGRVWTQLELFAERQAEMDARLAA